MYTRSARRVLNFAKATLIGGVFVLVPLMLLSLALGEAVKFAFHLVHPLIEWLEIESVSTASLAFLVGSAAVILGCFLAGLLARTAASQWLVNRIEQLILTFLPSYGLMKRMGQGWIGVEEERSQRAVLVRLDDAFQIGFVMDSLPDGRSAVFVPDVPTPWSGTLLIVAADRLESVPWTTKQTIECLRRLGANARSLWEPHPAA